MRIDDPILLSRLDAINDAQKRSRFAWFLCLFASGAILGGLWNLYASWDLRWASEPLSEGAAGVLQQKQIEAWVDANTVGVDLLGIKLSTSDAPVTGTLVLLFCVLYHCLCARRENHEIGAALSDFSRRTVDTRNLIYRKVSAYMIAMAADENDAPYTPHGRQLNWKRVPLLQDRWHLLVYLPTITALIILASDVYFALWYISPRGTEPIGAWSTLLELEKAKLVSMDIAGAALTLVIWRYCYFTMRYREATEKLMQALGIEVRMEMKQSRSATHRSGDPVFE